MLGGLAVYMTYRWQKDVQPFLSISSPDRKYTISFSGQKDRPVLPFVDHSVRFEITTQGEILLKSRMFLSGDSLDPSFEILFPNHEWIGNNTLLLYRNQYRRDTAPDTVEVINSSDVTIRYLGIRSTDCAILLDVRPHSTITFKISGARIDSQSIFVEGLLSDARELPSQGAGFDIQDKKPLALRITISETDITIKRI